MTRNSYRLFAGFLNQIPKSIPAFLLLLMPKCSLCLAAYLNIFTLTGISVSKFAVWIFPSLCIVMLISLITGFIKAQRLNDFRAFGLSFIGILTLLIGKIWLHETAVSWLGLVLILSATIIQLVQSRNVCSQDLLR